MHFNDRRSSQSKPRNDQTQSSSLYSICREEWRSVFPYLTAQPSLAKQITYIQFTENKVKYNKKKENNNRNWRKVKVQTQPPQKTRQGCAVTKASTPEGPPPKRPNNNWIQPSSKPGTRVSRYVFFVVFRIDVSDDNVSCTSECPVVNSDQCETVMKSS